MAKFGKIQQAILCKNSINHKVADTLCVDHENRADEITAFSVT